MKKKKHKFLKFLLTIFVMVGIIFALNLKFDLVGKARNLLEISDKDIKELIIPKLEIIDEDSNSRVFAVMINNSHKAWPHSGLQDAFLNYEIVVEGGITRIMSLFKDKNAERIGSIRSARHYFLDYAMENDAIYVHFGHSPQALDDISSFGIENLNGMYSSTLFWRDKSLNKSTEHTAFTNIEKIKSLCEDKGYRMTTENDTVLNFTTDRIDLSEMENSLKADKVEIDYSSYTDTSYEYDEESGLYKRFMSGEAHMDYVTEKQYTTKNIITYQIKNYSIDSAGRQTLENIGSGTGYYITNGYAVPITWEKTSRESKTIYKYEDGTPIKINDGVTWIQIQPEGKSLNIEEIVQASSIN